MVAQFIPLIIYITLFSGAGFALWQIRATVESVTEVFTGDDTALKSAGFTLLVGTIFLIVLMKYIK